MLRGEYRCAMLLAVSLTSGCAAFSPKDLAQPTSLTVTDALTDVGRGFASMKDQLRPSDLKLGLYPCKVTVNMNVTANAAQGGVLVLDASTAPSAASTSTAINTFSASGELTQTNTSSATRGNTIVVEMYSVACIPKETLGGTHPDKVGLVVRDSTIALKESPVSRNRDLRVPGSNPD